MDIIRTVYYIHCPWRAKKNFCCFICVSYGPYTLLQNDSFFTFILHCERLSPCIAGRMWHSTTPSTPEVAPSGMPHTAFEGGVCSCDLFQLDSLCRFSQRRSKTPHLGGTHRGGLWPPNSNSALVQCTYPLHFTIPCLVVRKLSCWQTNKETGTAEYIQRSSLRHDVG